jgi:hypothetical protein
MHEHPDATACAESTTCTPCKPQTPLRNHYFFGKLMDVPDFDVEQAYVVEKFKRHHARLHGTGVVCGLEVLPHPNPACRDRYVVVRPGEALDCCGNEILVLEEQVVDLAQFPELAQQLKQPDGKQHLLRLAVCYRECPTEDVPVLYDECGCDDTRCAPNRILEAYCFTLEVDPELPPPPAAPQPPTLARVHTIAAPGVQALLLNDSSKRASYASDLGGGAALVQQLRSDTQAPVAPKTFTSAVRAIASDAAGDRLLAVIDGAAAGADRELVLLDTGTAAAFAGAPLATATLPDSASATRIQAIAVGPAQVVVLLATATDTRVQLWEIGGGTALNALSAVSDAQLTTAIVAAALRSDGKTLVVAPATGAWQALDLSTAGFAPQAVPVSGNDVRCIAVAASTAPDLYVWCEGTSRALRLARLDGSAAGQVVLSDAAAAVAVDEGARTAFALLAPAAGASRLVAVDLASLQGTGPALLSQELPIEPAGFALALQDTRLWVGAKDVIALVDVEHTHCDEWLAPHACPDCEDADCVTLATIARWVPGRVIEAPAVPAADPAADDAAGLVRIDTRTHRPVVPSVADLAAAVRCLLSKDCHCTGDGQQGPIGPAGPGIDEVEVTQIACDAVPAPATLTGPPGNRTLTIEVNRGCDGKDGANGANGVGTQGPPGKDLVFDWLLPHICDISWRHGGTLPFDGLIDQRSLVVTFDTAVLARDLHDDSIRVQVRHADPQFGGLLQCWCDLNLNDGGIVPGETEVKCQARSKFTQSGADRVHAVAIGLRGIEKLLEPGSVRIRVLIDGDFIRGEHHDNGALRALDADHLPRDDTAPLPAIAPPGVVPDWLEIGDKRMTGDGIEGGLFVSWFTLRR